MENGLLDTVGGGVERVGQMEKRALTKMSFVKKKKNLSHWLPNLSLTTI